MTPPPPVPAPGAAALPDDDAAAALARSPGSASAQLELAVELGQIVIWRHDLSSDRLYYNPRGFEVLGLPYRPEGLSLAEVRRLIHPDDLARVASAAQEALRNDGNPTDMEARYRRSDGSWRHVLTRRVLQRDAAGRPLAFLGVALDTTRQDEHQQRADTLQRQLDSATAAAGIGIWSRDLVTEAGRWNLQMYRLCGRDPALPPPSRQEWIETVVHVEDRPLLRDLRRRLMASADGTLEYEYRILKPGGELRWLISRAGLEDRDGRTQIIGATLDITERRRADQALREANERVALATRAAGIATWEHDLRDGAVHWDAQMYLLRGLAAPTGGLHPVAAPDALRTRLAHPDELPLLQEANRRSIANGTMASYEFRVRWPDGSYRWLASRSVPVYDAAGQPLRQIGVNWDVQERVDAETARREALAAQRQSEAQSQFLARMSHELRTPLNAILGFTQLLEFEAQAGTVDDTPEQRLTKLRHIRNASEHLLALVNEVLDLSGIEAGELQVHPVPVGLDGLVAEALDEVRPAAAARDIRLHAETAGYTVMADRQRLRQVLVKLLGHRIRLIAPGSEVRVVAAGDGADAVLGVSDNGQALTPAQQLNLFEPFSRLSSGGDGPDTAVNLALVKSLMACMSGRIEVDSAPGRGTRFMLWLPQADVGGVAPTLARAVATAPEQAPTPPPAPAQPAPPAAPAASTVHGTVLYIEDNPVNVLLVEELIAQRGGLELVCETTGEAGVERARVLRPDLVLIDMQLPDFDGYEVLRRLRAQPETAGTRCVALSANAMSEDMTRALAAGFDGYWTKPIRFTSFLAGLDGLFPR